MIVVLIMLRVRVKGLFFFLCDMLKSLWCGKNFLNIVFKLGCDKIIKYVKIIKIVNMRIEIKVLIFWMFNFIKSKSKNIFKIVIMIDSNRG